MVVQYLLSTLLLFASALVATGLALYAWQRRRARWTLPFLMLALSTAEWALADTLKLSAGTVGLKLFWTQVAFLGLLIAPVAWLDFAVSYGSNKQRLDPRHLALLAVVPTLTFLLMATNNLHHLLWEDLTVVSIGALMLLQPVYGPWFWIHTLYQLLLLLVGALFLLRHGRERLVNGPKAVLLLIAALFPPAATLLHLLMAPDGVALDLTPVALTVAAAVLTYLFLRRAADLVPVAHESVIDSMADGVIVANVQERIVAVNPAAEQILNRPATELLGHHLTEALPMWRRLLEGRMDGELESEVTLANSGKTYFYELRVSPIVRGDSVSGRSLILHDVTRRRETAEELKARRKLFEKLVAVARATAEGPSLQGTLQNALDVATALTEAQYGSLFLLDSSGRVTHSILARGSTAPATRRKIVGRVMDQGLAGWAVRRRQPALVHDTTEDDRWLTLPDQPYAARSVLVVPIVSGPEVPGVLTLQHAEPHHFRDEDLELLRAASDQMTLALRNAQIYEHQRRLAERQIVLYEALRTIGGHLEPNTVINLAVQTISTLTDWPAMAILVADPGGEWLTVEAATGLLAERVGVSFPVSTGLSGLAFRRGETQVVENILQDDRRVGAVPELESGIFVPLRHGQQQLGVLAIESDQVAAFTDDDLWLAESLGEAVALVMANARLYESALEEHSRLQALINSSRDGILLIAVTGRLLVVNHTALDLLALAGRPAHWIGQRVDQLLFSLRHQAPDVVRLALAEARRIAANPEAVEEGEIELTERHLHWVSLPVKAEQALLGRLVVLQDVTRERALQQLRDDLTHTMVHDLRNPLNVVYSALVMIEELLAPAEPPDLFQILDIAQESTQRILNLVNSILTVSRLESEQMPLSPTPLDLNALAAEVVEREAPLAAEKGLQLRYISAPATPSVHADAEVMERVFQNLIGNAIKFTPPDGKVTVHVRAEGSFIRADVADSGPGIPPDVRSRLFQKFVTGQHSARGSGLGLAFCRMAVQAHGGRIWAESKVGEGATFTFVLPLPTAGEDARPFQSEDERHKPDGSGAPSRTIEEATPPSP
ncbi:MAG: histidine kinase N-terminal 7TM domain-containing protein [Candidatus Promineifilaceae bacterium]|nr:histidine kinase N-terminal 7TM domain-containing protein [Candidatus Promineifilaceae bacterium]